MSDQFNSQLASPLPSSTDDAERYTTIVARVLRVEDITLGDPQKSFIVRYRGQLYGDSIASYDQLAEALRPLDVTPLFRLEDDRHVILLVRGVVRPKPANIRVNLVLFALTVVSVLLAGALYSYDGPANADFMNVLSYLLRHLDTGLSFALSLLAILLAHEFGHYLAGRFHNTNVTLPYFIPFPLSLFGTMGAFISLKEIPRNRRVLLDIGIAGPLAGLVVAIPILLAGLNLSQVGPLPDRLAQGQGLMLEGNSLLYLGLKYIVKGEILPSPASYDGLPAIVYWVRYFFTGMPLPFGGTDVQMHPMAWAGWAGLLVTALNLIPAGQLDGGHVLYVLLGRKAAKLVPYILSVLFLLGFVWSGWWLWAFLIFIFGRFYAEPLDLITQLDTRRKALAILALIVFILVFIPVPLVEVAGG